MVPPLGLIFHVLARSSSASPRRPRAARWARRARSSCAMMKRRMTFDLTRQAVEATAKLSAFVQFILVGARRVLAHLLRVNGHVWVEHAADLAAGRPDGLS